MNDHELKIISDIPRRPTEMVTIFKNAASLVLAALGDYRKNCSFLFGENSVPCSAM